MIRATLGRVGLAVLLTAAAAPAPGQVTNAQTPGFGARVEVIARSVYIDLLDDSGRPVDEFPAGLLTIVED